MALLLGGPPLGSRKKIFFFCGTPTEKASREGQRFRKTEVAESPIPSHTQADSAPLNSAPISTQPATDFHVGISTPEFRRDDATLKYDVTLRQLSLSSCPNPSRAISCLDHRSSALLKFVSRGVGILLRWWRSFNRVGWEYRQPLR